MKRNFPLQAYARMPHLLDAPWVEAAASVPGCRFGAFTMETTSEVRIVPLLLNDRLRLYIVGCLSENECELFHCLA
jgi:hypothetical protein